MLLPLPNNAHNEKKWENVVGFEISSFYFLRVPIRVCGEMLVMIIFMFYKCTRHFVFCWSLPACSVSWNTQIQNTIDESVATNSKKLCLTQCFLGNSRFATDFPFVFVLIWRGASPIGTFAEVATHATSLSWATSLMTLLNLVLNHPLSARFLT